MQRKLVGLGLGSLGTITGLNFILKGENDDLSNKWIENREEDLNNNPAFEAPLPETVIEEFKKTREEQEALRKKREHEEHAKGLLAKVAQEDAKDVNNINTGKLRKWLIHRLKDDSFSIKIISRQSLDGMISSFSRIGNPTFFNDKDQINWEGVRVVVEDYNAKLPPDQRANQ